MVFEYMNASDVDSRTVTLETGDGRGRRTESDVRYLVTGDGPPVVLLHGIGMDSATVSWRHAIPALGADHRVYALDFPGHGESDSPRARYTDQFYLDVLEAFLEEVDLEGPSLVGSSMGGSVAIGYALEHDAEKLVLVDSYGLGEDAPWRPAASTLLRVPGAYRGWWRTIGASRQSVRNHLGTLTAGRPTDEHVADVFEAVQGSAGLRAMSSWQRSEFRYDGLRTCHRERLTDLDTPMLFVHGVEDPLFPAAWSERAAAETGADLELFEGVGHPLTREAPERFNETVRSFL